MKIRTTAIACTLGRASLWIMGSGLILIGLGEAINTAMLCVGSERQD